MFNVSKIAKASIEHGGCMDCGLHEVPIFLVGIDSPRIGGARSRRVLVKTTRSCYIALAEHC
jgi:hypothetical protein